MEVNIVHKVLFYSSVLSAQALKQKLGKTVLCYDTACYARFGTWGINEVTPILSILSQFFSGAPGRFAYNKKSLFEFPDI